MLDFRMETFLTVCNDMNFTHAAEHLNLTQPAVSQHIKHLEKTYGTELFIRDKKKLRLTPAGEILRSALETMRNDENTLKKRMQESLKGKKVLTFGVTMTIGEYAIVPALSRFVKHIRTWIFTSDMATPRLCSPIFVRERSILQLWKDILAGIITKHVSTKQKNTLLLPLLTIRLKTLFTA